MTTEGIDAVFLETHNWGKSAKFLSGTRLRNRVRDGPQLWPTAPRRQPVPIRRRGSGIRANAQARRAGRGRCGRV